jgi:hypothetical protein
MLIFGVVMAAGDRDCHAAAWWAKLWLRQGNLAIRPSRLRPVAWFSFAWGIVGLGVGPLTFLPPLTASPVCLTIGILLLLRGYQQSTPQPTG